jgi:hypothetical protein
MPISVRRAICFRVPHMLLGTSWSRISRQASCSIVIRFTLLMTTIGSRMVTGEVHRSCFSWSWSFTASSIHSFWLYQVTFAQMSSLISVAPNSLEP